MMRSFIVFCSIIAFSSTSSGQFDSSKVYKIHSQDQIIGVSGNKEHIYLLLEGNKGFTVQDFSKSGLSLIEKFEIDDKIGKARVEYFTSIDVNGVSTFVFKGFDKEEDEEALYSVCPGLGEKRPTKLVGFPGSSLREGKFNIMAHPGHGFLSVEYVPDQRSTEPQQVGYAVVQTDGQLITNYVHTFPHKGELFQSDSRYVDKDGDLWIVGRKFGDKKDIDNESIDDHRLYSNLLMKVPRGKSEAHTFEISSGGMHLFELKFTPDDQSNVKLIGFWSQHNTRVAQGIKMFSLNVGDGTLEEVWFKEFPPELIKSMGESELSEHYSKKKEIREFADKGVLVPRVTVIGKQGSDYAIVCEQRRFIDRSMSGYDSNAPDDVDYYYIGAAMVVLVDQSGIIGHGMIDREIPMLETEYHVYGAYGSNVHMGEIVSLSFKDRKDVHLTQFREGKMEDKIVRTFDNPKSTPDMWQQWVDQDGLIVPDRERREFKLLRFKY